MGVSFWPTFSSRPDIDHLPGDCGTAPNLNALGCSPTEYHPDSNQYLLCLPATQLAGKLGEVLNSCYGGGKRLRRLVGDDLEKRPPCPSGIM